MHPETVEALNAYLDAGGKIIVIGDVPSRSPSLKHANETNNRMKAETSKLLSSENLFRMKAPEERASLVDWTKNMLNKAGHAPMIEISSPTDSMYHVVHQTKNKTIYFFINESFSRNVVTDIGFKNVENRTLWIWEPETGERYIYTYRYEEKRIDLHLEPGQSLLLVFEEKTNGKPWKNPLPNTTNVTEVEGPWKIEFQHHNGTIFNRNRNDLVNLKNAKDSMMQTFAGTVTYQTSFKTDKNANLTLDLGNVYDISELRINDTLIGTRWYGKHVYNLPKSILQTENTLEIKVTTVLNNYVRSLENNPTAQRWAGNHELVNAGLVGPVSLKVP